MRHRLRGEGLQATMGRSSGYAGHGGGRSWGDLEGGLGVGSRPSEGYGEGRSIQKLGRVFESGDVKQGERFYSFVLQREVVLC